MITILSFLFLQSVWFGLAAVALIPLQAWLIPKLQRQINLLNKKRIQEVRVLAAQIGENAAGASTLRANGGWRYRRAMISDQLGRLFGIRFEIYQKKFFMKFINNFISQLTPFMFYLVGGLLVLQGSVSLGALVAALAAYKDLSSPWKELLTYYNQTQDMSLRWDVVIERFAPSGQCRMKKLFEGEPQARPHLNGDIVLDHVSVRDMDGNQVLDDLNLTFPGGQDHRHLGPKRRRSARRGRIADARDSAQRGPGGNRRRNTCPSCIKALWPRGSAMPRPARSCFRARWATTS